VSAGRSHAEDRERLARVLAVVSAGRRIADPLDPLGREARDRLPAATGLSPESVELALSEHLETRPSDDDLVALLERATTAPRCHVVLSANVCTAALRAIAIACATSPRVLAKPSRRDPVVAELCARALTEDPCFSEAGGSIELEREASPSAGDELHVYGSDETIAAIRSSLVGGVVLRAHGAGFGVAIVGEAADLDEAARSLARDVVPFDQRGCLSPRVALVIGALDRASRFVRSLARELAIWSQRAPRGALTPGDEADLRRYLATVAALGASLEGEGFAVGLDESPRALVLPPPARAVHVVPATPADLAPLLAPWASKIAAIGVAESPGSKPSIAALSPGARVSKLGRMQRPPLDGPVDLRGLGGARTRSPSPAPDP